ncbi:hypothetical protein Tco_1138521 [Tanacetum coccineum]
MIGKINLLWKTVFENVANYMAPKSIAAISHDEREELRKKGMKSLSKLFSLKYLFPASIKELNKNPSAPKCVHFVNSIVILSKDGDIEKDISTTNARRRDLNKMTRGNEELKRYSERRKSRKPEQHESFPTMKELSHHECFAYECDFMILEDTTSIIDRCLGEMVFGRPFIDKTGLVYDKEEGTVSFKQDNEKIIFKMPHTMEIFKQTRFMSASTNSIPSLTYKENFSSGRTHYYQSLLIGDEYKQDEGDRRGIRHLMRLEKEMMNEGEVT